ncbi:MAG: DUF885 family protein, partial [Pseudomonadota bacterium]
MPTITRHISLGLATVAISCLASQFAAADSVSLDTLLTDYWDYRVRENPILATSVGVTTSNDRLPSVTSADKARRLDAERDFLARALDLDATNFSSDAAINRDLLVWVLQNSIRAHELGLERIPFNSFSGFFTGALGASRGIRLESVADYEAYIARLYDFPRYFNENIANMRRGIDDGFVLPRIVIEGIAPTVRAQITQTPEAHALYQPFVNLPESIEAAEQARLRQAAATAIREGAFAALTTLAEFLDGDYIDAATATLGATDLPGGDDYYAFQIRRYATRSDLSPADIHAIGLDEVARIRAEMDIVIDESGFDGSFDEFTEFLRTDAQFYASTPRALLKEAAYIAKRIDYVLPGFFNTLPRLPYGVVPVPEAIAPNYTTASYNSAKAGGTTGGAYWVNTFALDQRPLYELTALTLHEAVPGHHFQIALAQELRDVPDFRQRLYFSAFGEGWALYTEKLGVEMGLYDDAYAHFGRL